MSNEPKPEPKIDENGVPWCTAQCRYAGIIDGREYCKIGGTWCCVYWEYCEPAVREMAAEIERLRAIVERLRDMDERFGHFRDLYEYADKTIPSPGLLLGELAKAVHELAAEAAEGGEG